MPRIKLFWPKTGKHIEFKPPAVKYLTFSTGLQFSMAPDRIDLNTHSLCKFLNDIAEISFYICSILYMKIVYGNIRECCLDLLDKGNISWVLCKESWEDSEGLDKQKLDYVKTTKRSECKIGQNFFVNKFGGKTILVAIL